jgi:hypothetical protein
MSASFGTLSAAAVLVAGATMFTTATKAADIVGQPPNAKALLRETPAMHWRGRDGRWGGRRHDWAAPSELIAGVRGATPLTIPFFGFNWYPGPVHYFGPPPGSCCLGESAAISVRY